MGDDVNELWKRGRDIASSVVLDRSCYRLYSPHRVWDS